MKSIILISILIVFAAAVVVSCVQNTPESRKVTKRVGMVVGINPGMIDEYKRLHADSYEGVRDLLTKYHMQNFSIFLQ